MTFFCWAFTSRVAQWLSVIFGLFSWERTTATTTTTKSLVYLFVYVLFTKPSSSASHDYPPIASPVAVAVAVFFFFFWMIRSFFSLSYALCCCCFVSCYAPHHQFSRQHLAIFFHPFSSFCFPLLRSFFKDFFNARLDASCLTTSTSRARAIGLSDFFLLSIRNDGFELFAG